ncbi:TonB-dependent receptor plug domain-containing protein [Pseudodesulfovibrio sediminis]|uniref:TonB-dependent receptor n=1 Tax=Pseudodesulfovibrio sediminis TaxID=2810563 RepID=A0ABM7P5K6_9BACT|nr:TonB-dependent receptor plug domain-containing protein [Pseudodesulfovibrio sediminis]BCS88135.1 TonB-dependent receptor [Pseudodesulfovibrio sediminis]
MVKVRNTRWGVFLLGWAIVALLLSGPAHAVDALDDLKDKEKKTKIDEDKVLHLEEVEVEADKNQNGKAELSQQELERMPNSSGSITEALKGMPNVQFDDASRSSMSGGSIVPPKISISGGKYYENNFSIDGISNNNRIDPSGIDDVGSNTTLGGEAENSFLNTDLLDSITVYSSNVPAKYGNFVGGVVDAKTRKPADVFGGKVSWMHTRDTWANHRPADREKFEDSSSDSNGNPKFTKNLVSSYIDIPLNHKAGVMLSYDITNSVIPLRYMEGLKDQYKTNQTIFGKLAVDIDSKNSLDFSVTLSEYEAQKFVNEMKDSGYDIVNPSKKIALLYEHEAKEGTYTLTAAFAETELERESEASETFNWTKGGGTTSTQWGSSATTAKEGGFGDSYRRERDLSFLMDYESVPVASGPLTHVFSLGTSYEYVGGRYERLDDVSSYFSSKTSSNVQDNGEGGIIANEQYASRKSSSASQIRSAHYHSLGYYLQDELNWGRVTFRPGARVDYDDLMENINVAPRFAAEYDVLGDSGLVFTAGMNRYYGTNLLGYALRSTVPLRYYSRTIDAGGNLSSWAEYNSSHTDYSLDGLNTPYSDEVAVGVSTEFLGVDASLNYVKRQARNQFATQSQKIGSEYFKTLTNDGETKYWGYTLLLEKTVDNHHFSLGATYSDQQTNFSDYSDEKNDGSSSTINYDKVYYNGKLIDRSELPAANYNRPWVGTFIYEGTFFDKLKFTSVTRYQSEMDTISVKGTETVGGEKYYKYEDSTLSESIIWDWKIVYEVFAHNSQAMQLDFVVDNVFDETAVIDSDGNRCAGRQLWVGSTYTF